MRNFCKWYKYVSQVVRMFDKELHRAFVYCAFLVGLLPVQVVAMENIPELLTLEMHNRSAHAAFTGFGKCVPNKQDVIFSKMPLLATTSSSAEKEISKQGFRMSKFITPVDAVIFSLGMRQQAADQLERLICQY